MKVLISGLDDQRNLTYAQELILQNPLMRLTKIYYAPADVATLENNLNTPNWILINNPKTNTQAIPKAITNQIDHKFVDHAMPNDLSRYLQFLPARH